VQFIPYALDRLPRDPSLRSVAVGDDPLRLNSEPVPPDSMPLIAADHAARVTAAVDWLNSQCGDYAPQRQQFIASYFAFIVTEIEAHQQEITEQLALFGGLYQPDDTAWSALRPLPRGWIPVGDRWLPADIVFWDGTQPIAIELGARETEREKALTAAGVPVLRVNPGAPDLPDIFRGFWRQSALPSSPFRRLIPSLQGSKAS
jgi:hypothetical protein